MNVHHLDESSDNSPKNLVPLCVACHAVLHIGFNLMQGAIEILESEIPQVQIVQCTREGVKQGRSLGQIKKTLPLKRGPHPVNSTQYASGLIARIGDASRAYLDEPLCVVFVNLTRWQIEK